MKPRQARITSRDLLRVFSSTSSAALAAVFVPTIWIVLRGDVSWAGASDEKTADVATSTYGLFLQQVGAMVFLIAVTQWIVVWGATFAITAIFEARNKMRSRRKTTSFVTQVVVALAVVAVYAGFGAQRHPGLFLAPLASSPTLAFFVEACAYLGPLVLVAVAAGLVVLVVRGDPLVRSIVLAVAIVSGGALVGATKRVNAFKPEPFSSPEPIVPSTSKLETDPPSVRMPHVLWIAVDSLRPDMIDKVNTPNIAKLVSESVYFPNGIVPVPRTGPSWTAAMTSLSPLTNGVETMFPGRAKSKLFHAALPGQLVSHGYRTIATSEYAGEFFGRVDFGFQQVSAPRAELKEISGQLLFSRAPLALAHFGLVYSSSAYARSMIPPVLDELVRGMPNFSQPDVLADDILAFVADPRSKDRPVFALAFYSQPHFPYTSSPRFGHRYRVSGSSRSLAYGRDVANETPITTDADKKQLVGLYRAALAETDEAIGKLFARLHAKGVLEDTIIVLTADHGEGLYECDTCVGHGDNLRGMMTLRVPIAFRLPLRRYPHATARVEDQYVSLLDVYPSLTALLQMEAVAIHEGQPLFMLDGRTRLMMPRSFLVETGEWLWTTAAVPKDRLVYPPITEIARLEDDRIAIDPKYDAVIRAAKHRALIKAPYKLTYEPTRDVVNWHLYDFQNDPLDTKDLAATKPEVFAAMKEELRKGVLRQPFIVPAGDWFVTRPPMPSEEHW